MQFDIHIQCADCDGFGTHDHAAYGVNANGPWVDITEQNCYVCEGQGLLYVGRETYDNLSDLKSDYPESIVQNIETREWS